MSTQSTPSSSPLNVKSLYGHHGRWLWWHPTHLECQDLACWKKKRQQVQGKSETSHNENMNFIYIWVCVCVCTHAYTLIYTFSIYIWNICISPPSTPRLREHCVRKCRKDLGAKRWEESCEMCLLYMAWLLHPCIHSSSGFLHKTCTRSSQQDQSAVEQAIMGLTGLYIQKRRGCE